MAPSASPGGEALETDSSPVTWSKSSTSAPEYEIPWVGLVGIEHPCIIRNEDRGIQTLGGLRQIAKVIVSDCEDLCQHFMLRIRESAKSLQLATRTEKTANLNLRPEKSEGSRIRSARIQTNNVVLRFSVPKRTGLKRKRGSYGPFDGSDAHAAVPVDRPTPSARKPQVVQGLTKPKDLLRSLQDNADKYRVEMIGHVEETHRFRGSFFPSRSIILTNVGRHA